LIVGSVLEEDWSASVYFVGGAVSFHESLSPPVHKRLSLRSGSSFPLSKYNIRVDISVIPNKMIIVWVFSLVKPPMRKPLPWMHHFYLSKLINLLVLVQRLLYETA